ncbi:MAG: FtsW/RodA/SpoVE family cell cycle protein [Eubacterium sp.]|nr:FtsW/RodA/SpoVE family cell cycle protein [Eubacterium sp.]
MAVREYDPVTGEEIEQNRKLSGKEKYFDYSLLFGWIFIMLLGYVLLYSASSFVGLSANGDAAFYVKKQVRATLIGLCGMIPVIFIDYRLWRGLDKLIYIGAVLSVFLVKTPLGISSHGAKRWVALGPLQFQPAEAVKIGVIVITAYMISKCSRTALSNWMTCWQIYALSVIGAGAIVVLTSNLSSALIILGIGVVMLIIAGACKEFVLSVMAIGAGGIFLITVAGEAFRMSRVMVWLHPEEYSASGGYQVMQGLYAIGSGGIFGKGLGNSAQKLGFVPEANNDMIFSIICEELGIFGAACIMLIFIFIIRRMRVIASNAADLYGSMLVVGVMAQISIQVVLNIAVVTNSMPNTGVSLPFISFGGTSLAFLMVEMGMVLSVSRRIRRIR